MSLLSKNKKMKSSSDRKYSVHDFALPANKTCPNAGVCKLGCYAKAGHYCFSNVVNKHESNLEVTKSKLFIQTMTSELTFLKIKNKKKGKKTIIRIHSAGDFYSREYLHKWLIIINKSKDVLFYAYTKEVSLFKSLKLPANFRVIFSLGGKEDDLINREIDKHARVFATKEELTKAGYLDIGTNDLRAPMSKNNKLGLVYHNGLKFENSGFSKIA